MTNIKIIDLQPIEVELLELSNLKLKAIFGGCLIVGDGKNSCCEAKYELVGNRLKLVSICGLPIPFKRS